MDEYAGTLVLEKAHAIEAVLFPLRVLFASGGGVLYGSPHRFTDGSFPSSRNVEQNGSLRAAGGAPQGTTRYGIAS